MAENLPMKTFNYGQTEYKLHVKFKYYIDGVRHPQPDRFLHRKVTPYMITYNQNENLISYLIKYGHNFPRFVQRFNEVLFENKHKKIIGEGFILKQSFLSYIIQAKSKVYDLFEEVQYKRIVRYRLSDYKFNNINKNLYTDTFDKEHNVILWVEDIITGLIEEKKATIYKDIISFDDKKFLLSTQNRYNNLIEKYVQHYNTYNNFVKSLHKYFESVNRQNDDDWDEYLNHEIRHLSKYMNDDALIQLQKEYDEEYKKRMGE